MREKEMIIVNESVISMRKYFYFGIKRLFDILCGLLGILFLIPLIIFIKIVSLCKGDKKSIFFKQKRLGKNGELLYIYKFRTMVPNAEAILKSWIEEDNEYGQEYMRDRKIENDPRITRLGNILRKTSLDEFPQFINVFKGEMSLIGPRPVVPDEVEHYKGDQKEKFLSMRPGLTGYWAANGRSCTTYRERVKLELYYIDHCSLWLDIKIVCWTIIKVIKREGAK